MALTFQTNLPLVIRRLERFRADLPKVGQRSIEPQSWLPEARRIAEETCRELAQSPEEHALVPHFVKTVTVLVFGNTMEWTMRDVEGVAVKILEVMQARQFGPLTAFAAAQRYEQVQQVIRRWVVEEKRKDKRDEGKTDAEIAQRISHIFFADRTEGRVAATAELLPVLQEYLDRVAAQSFRVSPERVSQWLEAVLAAWRARVMEELPRRVTREIEIAWKRAQN